MQTRCLISGLAALLSLVACSGPINAGNDVASSKATLAGGPCTYAATPGTATITRLIVTSNGMEAHFNFTPLDANAAAERADTDNHLSFFSRLPSRQWIEAQNITVSTKLTATRANILSGTCTPVSYNFPTLPDSVHGR